MKRVLYWGKIRLNITNFIPEQMSPTPDTKEPSYLINLDNLMLFQVSSCIIKKSNTFIVVRYRYQMIIVDWGDLDETFLVMRIEGKWTNIDIQKAVLLIRQLSSRKSDSISLIVDVRLAAPISAETTQIIRRGFEHLHKQFCCIVIITTSVLALTLQLIGNFYPKLLESIQITQSVDEAYNFVYSSISNSV